MQSSIHLTQAGRKYLILHNMLDTQGIQNREPLEKNVEHERTQSHLFNRNQDGKIMRLPRQIQLRHLPYSLNNLYSPLPKEQHYRWQHEQNIKKLEKQLLNDLPHLNPYTVKKAETMAQKMYTKLGKENISLSTEISKSRNYLERVNIIHRQQQNRYESIQKSIQRTLASKQSLDP